MIDKKGFHIRNQRGRFSLERVSRQNKKNTFIGAVLPICIGQINPFLPFISLEKIRSGRAHVSGMHGYGLYLLCAKFDALIFNFFLVLQANASAPP